MREKKSTSNIRESRVYLLLSVGFGLGLRVYDLRYGLGFGALDSLA